MPFSKHSFSTEHVNMFCRAIKKKRESVKGRKESCRSPLTWIVLLSKEHWDEVGVEFRVGLHADQEGASPSGGDTFTRVVDALKCQSECSFLREEQTEGKPQEMLQHVTCFYLLWWLLQRQVPAAVSQNWWRHDGIFRPWSDKGFSTWHGDLQAFDVTCFLQLMLIRLQMYGTNLKRIVNQTSWPSYANTFYINNSTPGVI